MLALVRGRCDRGDTAAVVVTHDVNLAAEFSDQIMLLSEGRTVAVGSPHAVLTPELLQKVFALRLLVDSHPISGAPRITPVHERQE
jgi:iron complex transport system ATP-binding protein